MSARVIKPAKDVEPTNLTVTEVCPCGARYLSGRTRDPHIWQAWAEHHAQHGMGWGRP